MSAILSNSEVSSIIDFWFHPSDHPDYGKGRMEWYKKDENFDNEIRNKFGSLVAKAVENEVTSNQDDPKSVLAHILLLDQFTRNIYRGDSKTYAGDGKALELAQYLVSTKKDTTLPGQLRSYVYLPYMHSEDVNIQNECVALSTKLNEETGIFGSLVQYAIMHQQVVVKYGRFPHRNTILGRESSPEELDYLAQPGSGF